MYAVSLTHCPFASYHFHLSDGFGWFSIMFVTATQKVPSEPWGVSFFQEESCGKSSQYHRRAEVGRHLWRLFGPAPLLIQRRTSLLFLSISKDRDSTASPGNCASAHLPVKLLNLYSCNYYIYLN